MSDPQFILLSAREEHVLRRQVGDLFAFVQDLDDHEGLLARIAYTLQVGRDQMDVRLVVRADSLEDLRRELAHLSTQDHPLGRAGRSKSALADDAGMHQLIENWTASGETGKLAEAWLAGFKIDWAGLYTDAHPRRINLPAYPFNMQRYWITESRGLPRAGNSIPESTGETSLNTDTDAASAPDPQQSLRTRSLFTLPAALQPAEPAAQAVLAEPEPIAAPQPVVQPVSAPEIASAPAIQPVAVVAAPAGMRAVSLPSLQDELSHSLAAALFMDNDDIDLDETFFELGVESVSGVEWIRDLNQRYSVPIKVSAIYDTPTLRTFSEFLFEKLEHGPDGQRLVSATIIEGKIVAEAAPTLALPAAAPAVETPVDAQAALLIRDLAEILVMDPAFFDHDQPFSGMGLTPDMINQFLARLRERLGATVSQEDLKQHGTPQALAGHLLKGDKQLQEEVEQRTGAYGYVLRGHSAPEGIKLQAWPSNGPAAGEVRIAVKASAVNFADTLCASGLYPTQPDYPFVPGLEVAGVVDAIGADVTAFAPGDDVVAVTGGAMGGHAAFVTLPVCQVVRKPRNLTFDEACSLPVAFLTMDAAFDSGRLAAGESVLIHAAMGGCGLMGIQLARLRGCRIHASSSSHAKRWKLKVLGIEDVLDYKQPFDEALHSLTGGRGVDVVVNTVPGEAVQRGLNALAPGGRYVELAVHALKVQRNLDLSRLTDNRAMSSLDLRRLLLRGEAGERLSAALARMVSLAEEGLIVPIVSRVYPHHMCGEAIRCVAAAEHVGKIVVSHALDASVNCEETCLDRMLAQHHAAMRLPKKDVKPVAAARTEAPAPGLAIAIVGMSGQFPMAKNAEAFWENLRDGKFCVGDLPYERWGLMRPEKGASMLYPVSGIMEDADSFDPLFFNISPKEARFMDPQQRTFLEACWSAIEDAGYAPASLSGTRCGVFAGCSGAGYGFGQIQETSTHVLMGHTNSILPARISYHLNFKGPCMAIDTACSSALVAVAEACASLSSGASDQALAGGVSVFASPMFSKMAGEGGMLSEKGRCFTFDSRADGFVPAEGVGVFLLKRLSDAERDGDRILGVIRGWGVNHDGKTNGMTAPSVTSQTALECEVYERFNLDPQTISYVEAHGTGTRLGDPIEVEALTAAFRNFTDKTGFCALGSVKSNIGHALGAAGAAGLMKVLLALKHRALPPTINYENLNPEIVLADTPFFVNAGLRDWSAQPGMPRRAAVSSFSYNGTNAHIVVEEHAANRAEAISPPDEEHLIVLSAKTGQALHDLVGRLMAHLSTRPEETRAPGYLRDLAYTLQVGRDAMVERLGFKVKSLQVLETTLAKIFENAAPSQVMRANVRASRKAIEREDRGATVARAEQISGALQTGDLDVLLRQWIAGADIDWTVLHCGFQPRRASLPAYPFSRKRYWFSDKDEVPSPAPVKPDDQRFAELMRKFQPEGAGV